MTRVFRDRPDVRRHVSSPGAGAAPSGAKLKSVLAGLAVATALAGCAGGSPAVRYHALSVATPPSTSRYAGLPIAVRTIQMPPGVDRIEMTRDLGQAQFVVREFDQWSAPLGSLARQTLVEDLGARLGAAAVIVPGGEWPAARLELSVDVLSYRVADGVATVMLNWGLRRLAGSAAAVPGGAGPADARNALRLETRLGGDDATSTADAWSALLGQLADRIAAAANDPRPAGAP